MLLPTPRAKILETNSKPEENEDEIQGQTIAACAQNKDDIMQTMRHDSYQSTVVYIQVVMCAPSLLCRTAWSWPKLSVLKITFVTMPH